MQVFDLLWKWWTEYAYAILGQTGLWSLNICDDQQYTSSHSVSVSWDAWIALYNMQSYAKSSIALFKISSGESYIYVN